MKNTKLIHVLKTLNSIELKRFSEYLCSPYFNKNQTLILFFDLLANHYPDFNDDKIKKEVFFSALFPDEDFKDERIRYLSSELLTLLEAYLSLSHFENQKSQQDYYLLKELYERNLESLFEIRVKEVDKYLERSEISTWSLHAKFLIEDIKIDHWQQKYLGKEFTISKKNNYFQSINTLNIFYLEYVLKMYGIFLTHANHYKKSIDLRSLEKITRMFHDDLKTVPPIIQIHYANIQLLSKKDEKYYFQLKKLLFSSASESLSSLDLQYFFGSVSNYCKNKYQEGNSNFLNETLIIYKTLIKKQLFLQNGHMPPVLFSNIVRLSTDAKDVVWAEKFIADYSHYLPVEQQESIVGFCLATLFFCKKDYKSALNYLNTARYESPLRQMGIKTLLLKIYYEKNDAESIIPLIDAYKHAIKQIDALTNESKQQFSTFILYFQKLVKLKANPDYTKAGMLISSIEKEKNLVQKIWLLEKAGEINDAKDAIKKFRKSI